MKKHDEKSLMKVGLLHTAASHVELFEGLRESLAPEDSLVHEVRPDLLSTAMESGITEQVLADVNRSLEHLVEQGCVAVSCTCSTLGELVENRVIRGVNIQRIDRAAADELMQFERVLVLASIESAAVAADGLLESSARKTSDPARWLVALVPGAWKKFVDGDVAAYEQTVADFANQFIHEYDAVFLSQASMAGAAKCCQHVNVVTSAETGLKKLLGQSE